MFNIPRTQSYIFIEIHVVQIYRNFDTKFSSEKFKKFNFTTYNSYVNRISIEMFLQFVIKSLRKELEEFVL